MGLGDADLLDDGDGGGGKASATEISCSICLEVVTDNLDRSWAKLQCGHQFHLDCIGSAFNVKGAMQCPNCRKIEKGQWLYANGSRPPPEFSMDDWPHDEDLYDQNYEMSLGLHWCPFSGLTRLFDEGEFSSSSYHDYLGQQALFAEHTTMSSTSHPCPYIAYIGPPIHPSSSTSSGSVSDGSNFNNNHWNGPSVPNEVPSSYAFPSMDVHYHNWDHSSSFPANNRIGGGSDQPSIPSVTQRTSRNSSDMPRPGMHPYMFAHSSSSRAPTSVNSSALPLYPGTVVRQRDRAPALQAYLQQSSNSQAPRGPLISSGRRSSSHRGLAQVAPIASSSDQSSGFYFFSSNSSGRTFQEAENPVRNERFHGWERDHQASYPLSHVDRDSIWGPFHSPGSGSDRSNNFRQRPSQYRS